MALADSTGSMLLTLGFTALEADVYITLLREPGITGYRVAQLLGKPVTNTYKALDSLAARGAVLQDDCGRSKSFSATPIGELIDNMVIGLRQTGEALETSLRDLGGLPPEEGIYRLQNVPQVYARAQEIIESAKRNLLVDAYQIPLSRVIPAVEKAAVRGVTCLVHAHGNDTSVKGCEVIESCRVDIPGEWMVVMADGREYMIAVISPDEKRVYQAVWSRNPFISPCVYQGYLNKALFYRITLMFGAGKPHEEISNELHRLWAVYGARDPGTDALNELMGRL